MLMSVPRQNQRLPRLDRMPKVDPFSLVISWQMLSVLNLLVSFYSADDQLIVRGRQPDYRSSKASAETHYQLK